MATTITRIPPRTNIYIVEVDGDMFAVTNRVENFRFSGLYKHSAEFLASHLNKMQVTIEQLDRELKIEKARECF